MERTWQHESFVRLESLVIAYELSLKSVPKAGTKIKLPLDETPIAFPTKQSVSQVEMEISNAFFLLVKALFESRVTELVPDVDWRIDEFCKSVGLDAKSLDDGDCRMLKHICGLRNALAHNYGRVDERTHAKIPELTVGTYFRMDRVVLRNWFVFVRRLFDLLGDAAPKSAKLH